MSKLGLEFDLILYCKAFVLQYNFIFLSWERMGSLVIQRVFHFYPLLPFFLLLDLEHFHFLKRLLH